MNLKSVVFTVGAMSIASIAVTQDQIDIPLGGKDKWYYTDS